MERDMTTGGVPVQLIKFALPILAANILQSGYSIVDMAVVGRFTGSPGLAAVSSAAMISFIIQSVCTGVTTGGSVLTAQFKGAGDRAGQGRTICMLAVISAAAAVLVTGLGLLLYRPALCWMNLPEAAMPHGVSYMQVMCLGTVFVFGYNAVCAVMRGLGDSSSPLIFVAVASVLNVTLDLILVGPLEMGTRGAALATVLSQGFSFVTALVHLFRRGFFSSFTGGARKGSLIRFFRENGRPDASVCAAILRIGLPAAIQMAVLNLSYLLVTGMLNGFGVTVAAAAGAGLKVNTFAAMPCWAVGQAVTAMAGQNAGAGDLSRTGKTARAGVFLALGATFFMMLFVQTFAEQIISVFDSDPETVRQGVIYLRVCCSLNCLVYAVMYTIDSFATGVGDSFFAMCNALLHSLVLRLFLSWLLGTVLGGGFMGIYWAECLASVIPALVGAAYYFSSRWKEKAAAAGARGAGTDY